MHRIAKFLLTVTAVIAMPLATAVAADASPYSRRAEASGRDVDTRLGGLRAEVHIDRRGVSERLSGKLLGTKQSLTISC